MTPPSNTATAALDAAPEGESLAPRLETTPGAGAADVRQAAMRTALWTTAGFGTMQILRFGSNVLLYWLLAREILGLMTLVDVFLTGLHMFSDVGIGSSIVRSKRGEDRHFLDTAWTLQGLRGGVLWIVSCLLAWPMSLAFNEPLLLLVIPVAALTAAVNGFNATALFTLERNLAQARLVLLQLTTYLVGMAVTLAWLLFVQRDVWGLVVGRLVGSLVEMVGSHLVLRGPRNRFHWDRVALHDLIHFGKWIFIGTACTFVADQADRLFVGKLEGVGMLAVYNIAVVLTLVPKQLMYALVPKLVFPLYSRAHHSGGDVPATFRRLHPGIAGFEAFMVTGLIACGPALIHCLYKAEFQAAGWMVQLLAVSAWLTMLEATGGSLLWALGWTRTSALSNAAKAIAVLVLPGVGLWLDGLRGLILGFVVADLARYTVTAVALHRLGFAVLRYDVPLTVLIALVSLLVLWFGQWTDELNKWLRLGMVILAVVLPWAGFLGVAWSRGMFVRHVNVAAPTTV